MRASIQRSEVSGKVRVPSSKSYTHRALVCASLAEGKSRITSPLTSDDIEATLDVVRKLGVQVNLNPDGWVVLGGDLGEPRVELFCRESGTTLRFMTAVCSLVKGRSKLTAGPSLQRRPIKPLVDAFRELGVDCSCEGESPPITVVGGLRGGKAEIRGDITSQFVSAILLVSSLAEEPVTLRLRTPLESKPYVLMTMDTQLRFGVKIDASKDLNVFRVERQAYSPAEYEVEGDWSSAAFLLASGAIAGEVEVLNLNPASLQADVRILDLLKTMGVRVRVAENVISVGRGELGALSAEVSDCPDLFPALSVLCSLAKGRSVISGVGRLRLKESDRVEAMTTGLRSVGITVASDADRVVIEGGRPKAAVVDPRGDHRIAMAFGLLGLACERIVVEDAECVEKSYPSFWSDLVSLGAGVGLES
jgi:3-phosphoshikimate 1-carboxyvinyltransferase